MNSSSPDSVSTPRSTSSRSAAISPSSPVPVTVASRSNGTRWPSTAAASTIRRTGAGSPSTWRRSTSARLHGSGRSSSDSRSSPSCPRSNSSRKNGLPPVRRCSAATARYGAGRPVTAASSAATSGSPSRSSTTLVTVCRRSSRSSSAASGCRRSTSSGR
ncbi:hypothetical protein [Rhizomonospora bruguierae]|uniref:hypothetical protein n=1 Tax=Rhizomonospora bruguierae TaxID=1581705 RepID=UPI0020BE2D99|nr:hypothetical protein [Micromonospora sp. NBRC 107566]